MKHTKSFLLILSTLFFLTNALIFFALGIYTQQSPLQQLKNPKHGSTIPVLSNKNILRFGVFGDYYNREPILREILKKSIKRDISMLFLAGDMTQNARVSLMDYFTKSVGEMQEELPREIPLFSAPGNHETDAGRNFLSFEKRFGPIPTYFYAGNALFFLLDSAGDVLSDSQLDWLDFQLAANIKQNRAEHIFLIMHVPPVDPDYVNKNIKPWDMPHTLRAGAIELERIIKKYPGKITAIITGHIHANTEAQFFGVPVIITGTAGGTKDLEPGEKNAFLEVSIEGKKVSWQNIFLETKLKERSLKYIFLATLHPFHFWIAGLSLIAFVLLFYKLLNKKIPKAKVV
jgi:Icc-related predicted phosphoesterase